MKVATKSSYWFILGSVLVALIIEIFPLPRVMQIFRPEVFYLVMIYWAIYSPLKIGLGFAFTFGLLLDVLQGSILGLHGIIMIAFVVFMHVFCQRIRMFDLWKQCTLIFAILCVVNLVYVVFQGKYPHFKELIVPAFISVIFWPGLVMLLSNSGSNPNNFYRL